MSKKSKNITSLKFKFDLDKNLNPVYKITQTNNRKKCIIEIPNNISSFKFIETVLNGLDSVKTWFFIIDNTQKKYYQVGIESENNIFNDHILEIKAKFK